MRVATPIDLMFLAWKGIDREIESLNLEMLRAVSNDKKQKCLQQIHEYQETKRSYFHDQMKSSY